MVLKYYVMVSIWVMGLLIMSVKLRDLDRRLKQYMCSSNRVIMLMRQYEHLGTVN